MRLRESLLPGRAPRLAGRRSAKPTRWLARLLLAAVAVALVVGLGRLAATVQRPAATTDAAAPSPSSPFSRGGPDAGRGLDADPRPWWAQVTSPDASARTLFDRLSPTNGRVVVRQTGRYRSLTFLRPGEMDGEKGGEPNPAGHIQSVAATAPPGATASAAAVILTELVPSYARLMLAAGLVAVDAGGTGLLEGGKTALVALVAGGGGGSLAAAAAAVVCASEAPTPPTSAALTSPSPPCRPRTRAVSIEVDPVVAEAAEAWFGAPASGALSTPSPPPPSPLGVVAVTGDAAAALAAAPPGSAALVFMDAMLGGSGGGGGGGGAAAGGAGAAGAVPPTPTTSSHHPPALLAPPFLASVAAALAPGGALVANLVFTGPDPAARADAVRAWAGAAVAALSARPGTGGDARHRPASAYVARPPPSAAAESSNLIVLVCKPTDDDAKVMGDATASTYLGGEVGAAALRRAIPRVAGVAAAGAGIGDLGSVLASLRPLEVGPRYGEQ